MAFFFTADYLYWQAQEDQLIYATAFSDQPDIGPTSKINIKAQDFNWSSGFKIGAGYKCLSEMWSLYLNWTHFNVKMSSQVSPSNNIIIASALAGAISFDDIMLPTQKAKSSWHLNLDMFDLELRRFLIFGKGFYIEPHIGLKGGWIDQTQCISYDDFQGNSLVFVSSHAKVLRKNAFIAIGPRIGLNGRWGREIGIFGNISTALLYGNFDINTKYKFNTDPFLQNGAIFNNQKRLRPMVQMLLGLDWTHRFKQGCSFSIKTAYETQYWWDQWENINNTLDVVLGGGNISSGNLLFHGLSIEGALSF